MLYLAVISLLIYETLTLPIANETQLTTVTSVEFLNVSYVNATTPLDEKLLETFESHNLTDLSEPTPAETVLSYLLPEKSASAIRRMVVPYEREWKTLMKSVGFNTGASTNLGIGNQKLPGSAYQRLPIPGYFQLTQVQDRNAVSTLYNTSGSTGNSARDNPNRNVYFDDDKDPVDYGYQPKSVKNEDNKSYDDYSIFDDSPTKQEDYAGGKWNLDNDVFGADIEKLDIPEDFLPSPSPFVPVPVRV